VKTYERFINAIARSFGVQVSRIDSGLKQLPIEATDFDAAVIASLQPYTMTSATRLWSLIQAVRYIEREGIRGDFVECGVWRGGSVMAMATTLVQLDVFDRQLWLFDTFEGMTQPTDRDIEAVTGTTAKALLSSTDVADGDNVWCVAGLEDVRRNVATTGYPMDRCTFVEGDVKRTLQERVPDEIALLRLDTDWYESTKASLVSLFPRLVVGGICILDDYGHWRGARDAVDEYFAEREYTPFMHPIDFSGRIFMKTRNLPI
jgi:O-methyltransferase